MLFHVIGLKCQECGSYNTCRTADREGEGGTFVPGSSNGSAEGTGGAGGDGLGPDL